MSVKEPYYWYVLYVKSNTEKRVADDILRSGLSGGYAVEPFCPETEFYYRKAGAAKDECYRKRLLFPAYVFIETDMPEQEFSRAYSSYVYDSQDIIRLLRYGKTDRIALPLDERQRLEFLLKGKRCLDRSVGVIEGDRVIITCGPLMGMEGLIKEINRHNRTATLKTELLGSSVEIKAALEIVSKR